VFDTTEINEMSLLIDVLNDSKFYKKLYFFATIYDETKDFAHRFGKPKMEKYKFGLIDADRLDCVNITIYKDKGNISYNRVGNIINFNFSLREQDTLTKEQKIIAALRSWGDNYNY
jgi:hypothetical protein